YIVLFFFFFQAEDGIRDFHVTGVQTCALPILNIETLGIPYIMINAYYDVLEPTSILLDDEKGGFLQTEHLIKLGHRNILGFFKRSEERRVGKECRSGC